MENKQETKNEAYDRLKEERKNFTHISFSEFSLYMGCPHKHLILKYLNLDNDEPSINLFFGNAIHESFEFALRDGMDLENRVKKFRERFYKKMVENMKDHKDFKETAFFLDQGENIIRTFPTDKIYGKYEIVSVEEDLYENLYGKYHFKGFIDLVLKNKKTGRIKIIDWKTSGECWEIEKKKKDEIFMCQMRFYKFFWARKHNFDIDDIDCEYIVLNRLQDKKNSSGPYGSPQYVPIQSTLQEMEISLKMLATAIKGIHIDNIFIKIKSLNPKLEKQHPGCLFCKYKGGLNKFCNTNSDQYKILLKEYKK